LKLERRRASTTPATTPPTITLNGNDPAITQVGGTPMLILVRPSPDTGQAKRKTRISVTRRFSTASIVSKIVIVEQTAAPSIVPMDEGSTTAATATP
jgi:hypothetical protein